MTFLEDDPPDSYKKFKREIRETIEETEIYEDESGFPSALFLVNREKEGHIIYTKEFVENEIQNEEDDEEVDLDFVITVALPYVVKAENSKFYAFVFSGEKVNSDGSNRRKIVCILSGSAYETDMIYSEFSFEDGELILEPWEKEDILGYTELITPFRKAITLQG